MSQVVHAIPLPGPRRLEGRFVHVPHSPGFMLKACRTACMICMHACIEPQYIRQMKALDVLFICYFIHHVIFLNYLFARSKKLISKICKAFDVIENLVWTKQEIFACFVFPSLLNKYLRKSG